MASNSFGHAFRYTTWGESHGDCIGCVVDGVPPGIELSKEYIQKFLDERRPGTSEHVSARKEKDQVDIVSGVFDGKTTGAPISLLVQNTDHRHKDYEKMKTSFRPGHADYVYYKKYCNYDYRGGGRSSARETAMRVAAGAIALKILPPKINIVGCLTRIGDISVPNSDEISIDWEYVKSNQLSCPCKKTYEKWLDYLGELKASGDSVGALVKLVAYNVPIGLGDPTYRKLDAYIGYAILSINAVKSVEIGLGSKSARVRGSQYADEMRYDDTSNEVTFLSNNSGGICGGISTSQPIEVTFAIKPASSINIPLKTITRNYENTLISTDGRHDPCLGIRAVPVGKAMLACVLADSFLSAKQLS